MRRSEFKTIFLSLLLVISLVITMVPINVFATTTYKVTCYMAYGFNNSNATPITTASIHSDLAYMKEVYHYDSQTGFELPEPTVTFDNYEFMGWSIDGTLNCERNVTIPKGSIGNKIYIARWLGKEITVNFDSKGGNAVEPTVARYNEKIGTLPIPTRDGYKFNGWYTEPESGTRINSTTTVPTTNVTYYAHWSPIEYEIVLSNYDGNGYRKSINYTIETDDIIIGNPTENNDSGEAHYYIFQGWVSSDNDVPQHEIVIPKGSFGNKYFTGTWKNPCYYGHDYENIITAATVNSDGESIPTCRICKEKKPAKTISKIDIITLNTIAYAYDGNEKKPTVKVLDSAGNILNSGIDYSVTYKNNTNIGIATAIITFKGKYAGTVNKNYEINPKGTTIKSIYPESKKIIIKWNKQSTQTSGYQIEYTCSSKVDTPKLVTIKGSSVTSKAITKLANNKDYYVRIRTYNDVNGIRYYSSWSSLKKVHVDKVQLSSKGATLYRGQTKKLSLKYIPEGTKVTWKSSNKKVATVSSSGKVTAKGLGKTIISTKYKGTTYKATINVTYMKPNYGSILYDYDTRNNYFIVKIKNNSRKTMTILPGTTIVKDADYKSFDRKISLSRSYTIKPGKMKTIKFKVKGNTTWYDVTDFTLYYYFKIDGKKYYAKTNWAVVSKYKSGSKWKNSYTDIHWFEDFRMEAWD